MASRQRRSASIRARSVIFKFRLAAPTAVSFRRWEMRDTGCARGAGWQANRSARVRTAWCCVGFLAAAPVGKMRTKMATSVALGNYNAEQYLQAGLERLARKYGPEHTNVRS